MAKGKFLRFVIFPSSLLAIGFGVGVAYVAKKENLELLTIFSQNSNPTFKEELYRYMKKSCDETQWPKYNIRVLDDKTDKSYTKSLFVKFFELGLPSNTGHVNIFSHFISVTDSRLRIPLYVAWTIPRFDKNLRVVSDRKYSKFQDSPHFSAISSFNPLNNDYFSYSYSRGHLANCGDFVQFDQKAMNDTHLLAHNIVPQKYENNARYWLRMERYTRYLAERFDAVHVIAGPAFVAKSETSESKSKKQPKGVVKYLVIGQNNVAIPTHLFRIIIAEQVRDNGDSVYFTQAFIVPNEEINKLDHLTKYKISLKQLEEITGLRFLEHLERSGRMRELCCFNTETSDSLSKYTYGETCACNCDLPPWQDVEFNEILWKKDASKKEIEEKWEQFIKDTNWQPSKDIINRKAKKLKEIDTVNTENENKNKLENSS